MIEAGCWAGCLGLAGNGVYAGRRPFPLRRVPLTRVALFTFDVTRVASELASFSAEYSADDDGDLLRSNKRKDGHEVLYAMYHIEQ